MGIPILVERPPLIRFPSIVILCRGIPALSVAILRECTNVMPNLCGTVFDSRGIQQQRGLVVNQKLFCFQLLKTRFLCSKRTSVGCIYFSAGTTMLCAEAQSFVRWCVLWVPSSYETKYYYTCNSIHRRNTARLVSGPYKEPITMITIKTRSFTLVQCAVLEQNIES